MQKQQQQQQQKQNENQKPGQDNQRQLYEWEWELDVLLRLGLERQFDLRLWLIHWASVYRYARQFRFITGWSISRNVVHVTGTGRISEFRVTFIYIFRSFSSLLHLHLYRYLSVVYDYAKNDLTWVSVSSHCVRIYKYIYVCICIWIFICLSLYVYLHLLSPCSGQFMGLWLLELAFGFNLET